MIGKLLSGIFRVSESSPVTVPDRSAPTHAASSQPGEHAEAVAPSRAPSTYHQEVLTTQLLVNALLAQPEHADPKRLERYGWKAYSQNDEDGILQEIFRRIGAPHRSFVEFGCGDGLENNSSYLLSQGWRGLWMDGGDSNAQGVHTGFGYLIEHGLLQFKQTFITRDNVDALIAAAGLGPEIDLLSIDLDGIDYYTWEAIVSVSPRVVVMEYNAKYRPPNDWCMTYNAEHVWDGSDRAGSSLSALHRLARIKGYQLVGCNITGANAFFVRDDLAGDLFAMPATPEHLFQQPRHYLTPRLYGGQISSSMSIVEGASLRGGLPWPPAGSLTATYMADPAKISWGPR